MIENGDDKPITFASKIVSQAEKNYAQIDKEALALTFGFKSFIKRCGAEHSPDD